VLAYDAAYLGGAFPLGIEGDDTGAKFVV